MPAPCVTWFEFDLHHRVAPSHDRAIADDPLSNSEGVGVSLSPAACCLHGRQGMEHLWSRAVATGGNRSQMGLPRKRLEQAKTVAMGCDQLPGPMVRRGSAVRVRQRASDYCLLSALFRCPVSSSSAPGSSRGGRCHPHALPRPALTPAFFRSFPANAGVSDACTSDRLGRVARTRARPSVLHHEARRDRDGAFPIRSRRQPERAGYG
jgi:hypothetical protein